MIYFKYIIPVFILTFYNLFAQSSINPDISLIGTFNTSMNFIKGSPAYGKLNFENPSMELFFDGYLNPYARATANIAYEGGEFGVEELYANIVRGLPLDIQIKAGKYLVGFGKLNTVHPHAWAFINRPLFHQVFFSPDGFNDVGVDFNFLLPTGDIFTGIDLGIFKGNSMLPFQDSLFADRGISPIFVGRLGSFIPVGDFTNIEVGISNSFGTYAKTLVLPGQQGKALGYIYTGFDFKYKYVPDSYTALTIQGEGLMDHRDVFRQNSTKKITNFGAFAYIDYKFNKLFSTGVKYDYTDGIADNQPGFAALANDDKNHTQGIEAWFSYYPVEETSVLRLDFQHLMFKYADGINRNSENTVTLQFLFSLGPHKAHPF
jgi:hypothetical protein